MRPNLKFSAALVTFTEENLNGKLHYLCSEMKRIDRKYRGLFRNLSNNFDDLFCKNSSSLKSMNYFYKNTPSEMFDSFLITRLKYIPTFMYTFLGTF